MTRPITVWLVVALAAAIGSAWFFANFERVTETVNVGYRGEARRNQFLAAERMFTRLGATSREVNSLSELSRLPRGGALLVAARRAALGPLELDALLAWADGGGRLIVEAERPPLRDPLLERLQVSREQYRRSPRYPQPPPGDAVTRVPIPGRNAPLRALLLETFRLTLPATGVAWHADNAIGSQLAALRRGAGTVVVATSLDFMRNALIGQLDHAELTWSLAGGGAAKQILVLQRLQQPSLLAWLRANAWQALVGLALLIALWLWRIVPRFGPTAPDPPPGRRRLLDHLRAVGRFHWQQGDRAALLRAAREACLARSLRAHPEVAALAQAERSARLAEIFALPADELEGAFGAEAPRDAVAFTRRIALLQSIHERLARRPSAGFKGGRK
jgi:Domain of unknown function (DUF4350)